MWVVARSAAWNEELGQWVAGPIQLFRLSQVVAMVEPTGGEPGIVFLRSGHVVAVQSYCCGSLRDCVAKMVEQAGVDDAD